MKISVFNLRNLLLVIFALSLSFTSCKKDEEETEEEPAVENPQASAQPNFEGADASLWAVRSITTMEVMGFPVETTIGLAVAVFFDGADFIPAGTVQCNSNQLDLNPNNSYAFVPGATDATGIDFTTGAVTWDVSGANGFTQFQENVTAIDFPSVGAVTSSTTVPLSGYTLSTASVTGADSVLFIVGDVMKTLGGNATSCTFSADELSGLAAGAGVAQVAAYTYYSNNIGGKEIYFGNEAVQSQIVTYE